jgi:hypothetical protein
MSALHVFCAVKGMSLERSSSELQLDVLSQIAHDAMDSAVTFERHHGAVRASDERFPEVPGVMCS